MAKGILRFAVGSESEAFSSVWNLVVKGDDLYLFARWQARWLKTSLHSSATWRIAYTAESKLKAEDAAPATFDPNDRVLRRWKRPREFQPGWTHGIDVVVPFAPVQRPLRAVDAPTGKAVTWVRRPAPGDKVVFSILFVSRSANAFGPSAVVGIGDRPLGSLDLARDETAWVIERRAPMTTAERDEVNKGAHSIRINPGGPDDEIEGASLMFIADALTGTPVLVNYSLGRENVPEYRES